jgi:hypothetical protein
MTSLSHPGRESGLPSGRAPRQEVDMAAATPNQAGTLRWRPGDVVVTRHVRVPSAKLVRRLTDPDGAPRRLPLPGGELTVVQRLGVASGTNSWRARGKLRLRRRRLVPFPPIENRDHPLVPLGERTADHPPHPVRSPVRRPPDARVHRTGQRRRGPPHLAVPRTCDRELALFA